MDNEEYRGVLRVVRSPKNAFKERHFWGEIGGILNVLCDMRLCFRGLRH